MAAIGPHVTQTLDEHACLAAISEENKNGQAEDVIRYEACVAD